MNFSSKKIEEVQKLIDKIHDENDFLLKEKNECDKKDIDNQKIIDENKHLKDQNFENKIQEKIIEIEEANRILSEFIKHNNFKKQKKLIDESLDNFKIHYNRTDSLKNKMDLLVEFSKTIKLS
ncbi:7058_t:CDS:1 [Cetraspora pellucida]|uniref:7058_t:CDS:1 n=1 Tax=Cetraspora pellucida TaxID=1433469 RepID=A0ACA9MED7_9GLOM|nr:7058_t:CDS:1 [Cetraspora pellucida]